MIDRWLRMVLPVFVLQLHMPEESPKTLFFGSAKLKVLFCKTLIENTLKLLLSENARNIRRNRKLGKWTKKYSARKRGFRFKFIFADFILTCRNKLIVELALIGIRLNKTNGEKKIERTGWRTGKADRLQFNNWKIQSRPRRRRHRMRSFS